MDSATPSLDFAVIAHQDSWENIAEFVNGIRGPDQETLSIDKIKDIFPFIPPRDLFRVKVHSKTGAEINGVYIDTFIEPDKLGVQHLRSNIKKVNKAISRAIKMGAKIVSLGGFTSIVIGGNFNSFSSEETRLTTGNTLASAFIVKGVEKAMAHHKLELKESAILIIGATGDIGLACVEYFKGKTRELLLNARNKNRLEKLADKLDNEGVNNTFSISLNDLIHKADVVICAASSSGLEFSNYKKHVLVCDAGYPKNLETKIEKNLKLIFHGGMGHVSSGFEFNPDYTASFYKYPAPFVIHGCILEAMVLALENKFENYSVGKGNISMEKLEEIYQLALKHGIVLAPFYNTNGLC